MIPRKEEDEQEVSQGQIGGVVVEVEVEAGEEDHQGILHHHMIHSRPLITLGESLTLEDEIKVGHLASGLVWRVVLLVVTWLDEACQVLVREGRPGK